MKVRTLIRRLENLREDLKDKEVYVAAPNGMPVPPEITFLLKDPADYFNRSRENVIGILLSWR